MFHTTIKRAHTISIYALTIGISLIQLLNVSPFLFFSNFIFYLLIQEILILISNKDKQLELTTFNKIFLFFTPNYKKNFFSPFFIKLTYKNIFFIAISYLIIFTTIIIIYIYFIATIPMISLTMILTGDVFLFGSEDKIFECAWVGYLAYANMAFINSDLFKKL